MKADVKPTSIDSFSKVLKHFESQGFSEEDVLTLLQKKTKPRQTITSVRATIDAIKTFEKQIERAFKKFDKNEKG